MISMSSSSEPRSRQRSLKNVGGFLAPSLAVKLLPFCALPLLAKHLSLAEFGLCGILTTVFLFGNSVLGFGQDTVMFFESRGRKVSGRSGGISDALIVVYLGNTIVVVCLLASLVAGALGGWGSFYIAIVLEVVAASLYSAGYMPLTTLARINYQPRQFALITLGFAIAQYGIKLTVLPGASDPVLAWAMTDVGAAFLLLAASMIVLGVRRDVFWPSVVASSRMGLPLVPSKLAQWLQSSSDRSLITERLGAAHAGQYTAAGQFSNAALSMVVEVCRYFTPALSEYTKRENRCIEFDPRMRDVLNWQILAISAGSGTMSTMAPVLISFLYPPEYSSARSISSALALSVLVAGLGFVVINFVTVSLGRTNRIWVWTLMAAATSIVVNLALLERLGLPAAVVASVAGYGVVLIGISWSARRELIQAGALRMDGVLSVLISLSTILLSIAFCHSNVQLLIIQSLATLAFSMLVIRDIWKNYRVSDRTARRIFVSGNMGKD